MVATPTRRNYSRKLLVQWGADLLLRARYAISSARISLAPILGLDMMDIHADYSTQTRYSVYLQQENIVHVLNGPDGEA